MFWVVFFGPELVESYCGGRHPSKARVSEERISTSGAGRKLREARLSVRRHEQHAQQMVWGQSYFSHAISQTVGQVKSTKFTFNIVLGGMANVCLHHFWPLIIIWLCFIMF